MKSSSLVASFILLPALCCLVSASDWVTVGGNNEHNGLSDRLGPSEGAVRWEAEALPATISMQAYTWDTLVTTMRYNFSPMEGPLVCHSLLTGESLWTRLYRPAGKFVPFGFRDGRIFVRNFRETGHDSLFCIDGLTGDILWQSQWTASLGVTWCGCFASNGDLITPCAEHGIVRLDKETGDTLWTNDRPIPNTGAEWIAMSDTIVYAWEGLGINRPKYLIAISANSGQTLHRTAELPGDGDQEMPFVVGPGHVVYCQRDGGLFYAFKHTDTGFVQLWSRTGGGSTWMNYGVGPDSTVYIPIGRKLYRLDPATGIEVDSSPELTSGDLVPRISIDQSGFLYVMATTGMGEGRLWCLSRELDSVWTENYGYSYYSGPAIGKYGITVVAGAGTLLKAYQPASGVAEASRQPISHSLQLTAFPNPLHAVTVVRVLGTRSELSGNSVMSLRIFDAAGRLIRSLSPFSILHSPFSIRRLGRQG